MPSSAYQAFKKNRVDVVRLIDSHGKLHDGNRGRKGLGHITRSGVVMLCACWELYAESLLVEALRHLSSKCDSPDQLPMTVQKALARHVREAKHELRPLALANSGWRDVLIFEAQQECGALNTPKAGPLDGLYKKYLGMEKLSDSWTCGAGAVNAFVAVRGNIAHRGRDASYVPLPKLREYLALVDAVAKENDNAVRDHLKPITPGRRQAWKSIG